MDAIESGIVKVPRLPVDDDAPGQWSRISHSVGCDRPAAASPHRQKHRFRCCRLGTSSDARRRTEKPLPQLRAGTRGLRCRAGRAWRAAASADRRLSQHDRLEAGLRMDRRTRSSSVTTGRTSLWPAISNCSANVVDGTWTASQRTLLVDSVQLESGEPLKAEFKQAAAHGEIAAFKRAPTSSATPGPDPGRLTDGDLLRGAMNTDRQARAPSESRSAASSRCRC